MKFKSVDIVGFRAYAHEGDGSFDFCKADGSASNFISIYAPNGFGKSSFYDAMEWAITNNIGRYIREGQKSLNQAASLHLNTSSSSQKILRNRYISDEMPSYVTVKTTGKEKFHRKVRRAAAGQRDYTYDPALTDKETKHLVDIFLSQDAIDAFLKEERPELRYERFMFDFGGADEKHRSQLFSLLKLCNKEISKFSEKIAGLASLLEEPSLGFSIDQVNETIGELKALGSDFPVIDANFSELAQTELQSLLSKRIVELESSLVTLNAKRNAIYLCVESLPRLEEQQILRDTKRRELNGLQVNKNVLEEINKARSSKDELERRLQGLVVELKQLNSLIASFGPLLESIASIDMHEAEIGIIDAQIGQERVVLESSEQIARAAREERINLDTVLISILDSLSSIEPRFSEIEQLEALLAGYKQKLGELERRKNSALALKKALLEERNNFSGLAFGYTFISELAIGLLKPDSQFTLSFNQQLELRDKLQVKLRELDEQAKNLGSQSEDLYNLLDLARSLLSRTLSDTCPVCSASYESYNELLLRIQSNDGIESGLNAILRLKNDSENQLAQVDEYLARGLAYLNALKSNAIDSVNQRLKEVDSDIGVTLQEEANIGVDYAQKSESLHRLKAIVKNLSRLDYSAYLQNTFEDAKSKINESQHRLIDVEDSIDLSKKKVNELLLKKAKASSLIAMEKNSPLYVLFTTLKDRYRVDSDDFSRDFIERQEGLALCRDGILSDIEKLSSITSAYEQENNQGSGYLSIGLLNEKLVFVVQELEYAEGSIAKIEADLRKVIGDVERSNDALLQSLLSSIDLIEQESAQSASAIVLCNILQKQLSDALPFVKYWKAREEIGSYQVLLDKLQMLALALNNDLRMLEARLKQRIDSFFYTDLITAIYRKIDPHPFFKLVKFECVFPVDEKPRLEVYLYEDEASQPISPSLYFSSAQLNILSLSVFLAKALHVEHNGEPVRAILIDDPIHSMDSINVLSVIDLLRNISVKFDRQIIISTHDENFYELLRLKVPEDNFGSKFIRFKSFGVVVQD